MIPYFLSTWTPHTWFSFKKHCKQERKHDEFSKRGANFCHMGFFFSCFYVSANGFFEIQELRIENTCFFFSGEKEFKLARHAKVAVQEIHEKTVSP